MRGIIFYDVIFLILFSLAVGIFLYVKRDNLKREGIMFLYRTSFGLKFMDKVGKRHKKFFNFLRYPIILTGFVLMISIIYLLIKTVQIYFVFPQITEIIKAPPVMPLIPYFPQLFGVESFLPNFYFVYFLIALIVVAIVHEFAHGIYMRLYDVKIKSSGFGFLGPILAFFVEQDDKQLVKRKNSEQMTILAAGVFANLVTAGLFLLLLVGFFSVAYEPAGYIFDSYTYTSIPESTIESVENYTDVLKILVAGNMTYFMDNRLTSQLGNNFTEIYVYDDAPAVKSELEGIIVGIDGENVQDRNGLSRILNEKNPGEIVDVATLVDGEKRNYEIKLGHHPYEYNRSYLGVSNNVESNGGRISSIVYNVRDDSVYYETIFNYEFTEFIYYLIWWIFLINFFVGLFNMLPIGILDGGRFFYLSVLSLTGSEKIAKKSFSFISYFILVIFILLIYFYLVAL